jgi:hypothetical protein
MEWLIGVATAAEAATEPIREGHVTWTNLLAAAGLIGVINMGIFGWLFSKQQALEVKVDSGVKSAHQRVDGLLEDKQDKTVCGTTHQQAISAMRDFTTISTMNGERLAKIEVCLNFLVEGFKEHRQAHKDLKLNGGM